MNIEVPVNFLVNISFDIDKSLSPDTIQCLKDRIGELVYDALTGDGKLDELVESITEETGFLIEDISASVEN